jgi:ketosteroid isomerase-like protein
MSQENVDLVRRWYLSPLDFVTDAADDSAFVDRAFREYLDEQFETQVPGVSGGERVFRGREGVRQLLAIIRDAWSEWRWEPERVVDAGDQVLVLVQVVGRGRVSGVPIKREDGHVVTVLNGRIRSVRTYRDRHDALEAVGLRE